MDKIVIDIETKNSFADVGGQDHIGDLDVSFVGVYSYDQDKYLSFFESQLSELGPILQSAGLVVGFSINRFDLPVLNKYFNFNTLALPRLDLLEEVEMAFGARVSLNILAKTNLGVAKTHHGLEAIDLYRDGKLDELKDYCLNDVKITKDLYELIKRQGHLMIPKKFTEELVKVPLTISDMELPMTLF